ncbi:riboflavin synthase [bacterium]|nr:riboflavin synthase [bacterium]
MFTGLIEEVGKIKSIRPRGDGATLTISANTILDDVKLGDSISISGVCQTVIGFDDSTFTVEAIRETMQRTRFGSWQHGDAVNLERAMMAGDRFGGHIVQGHVDGLIKVERIQQLAGSWRVAMQQASHGKQYIVEKGSVCLEGISLTVAKASEESFEVEIIPHTWEHTTLKLLRPGMKIHVEWDMMAKYVERMIQGYTSSSGVTLDKLRNAGF